jgi:hypothetical protein
VDKGDQIELILTRLVRLKACGPTAIRAAVALVVWLTIAFFFYIWLTGGSRV